MRTMGSHGGLNQESDTTTGIFGKPTHMYVVVEVVKER